VCNALDLRVAWTKKGIHFTGRTIHLPSEVLRKAKPEDVDIEVANNLSHEIGHWLAASPGQRSEVNWGLGISYSFVETYVKSPIVRTAETFSKHEERASAIGLLVRHRIEGQSKDLTHDFYEQSWCSEGWREKLRELRNERVLVRLDGLLWPAELVERAPWLPASSSRLRRKLRNVRKKRRRWFTNKTIR
jgi:hypothetical protein